ncbi:hypothetical protein LCGC14_0878180 [marine sediment metagenome]|uniref:Uncharacterized protein n=1 Tax=marine sediment metagenome TaxID=412755 RepID=A0A0F9RMC8_9ZZZZ
MSYKQRFYLLWDKELQRNKSLLLKRLIVVIRYAYNVFRDDPQEESVVKRVRRWQQRSRK